MKINFLFVLLLISNSLWSQNEDIPSAPEDLSRKYCIKLRVISSAQLVFNYNKQIIGLELERKLKENASMIVDLDFGYFDNYYFVKYYDFFQNIPELPYTKTSVKTTGFHIAPNYRYYILKLNNQDLTGFHIGGAMDLHYYNTDINYFDSRTNEAYSNNYSSMRIGIGGVGGFQLMIKSRFVVDLSGSLYYSPISFTSNKDINTGSKNSIWLSENNQFWAVFRLKIGYAFGK